MIRRVLAVLAAFLVLSSTGCGLLSVLALPFELLFDLIGGILGLGADAVDAVVRIEPIEGEPPRVSLVDEHTVALTGVTEGSRFRIAFLPQGADEPVRWTWPDDGPADWRDAVEGDARLRVTVDLGAARGAGEDGTW